MNTYLIKGADRMNGADKLVSIDAPDQRSAEQRANQQGILVEDTYIVNNPPPRQRIPISQQPLGYKMRPGETQDQYYLRKIAHKDRMAFYVLGIAIVIVIALYMMARSQMNL